MDLILEKLSTLMDDVAAKSASLDEKGDEDNWEIVYNCLVSARVRIYRIKDEAETNARAAAKLTATTGGN
jgi:hypothetical protein